MSLLLHFADYLIYRGINLLYLKNHKNEQKMTAPVTPVIISTHLNADVSSNNGISKFIPNIPATTPNIATTNVAVVSKSSNCISWLRTLSCKKNTSVTSQNLVLSFGLENLSIRTSHILLFLVFSPFFEHAHACMLACVWVIK